MHTFIMIALSVSGVAATLILVGVARWTGGDAVLALKIGVAVYGGALAIYFFLGVIIPIIIGV